MIGWCWNSTSCNQRIITNLIVGDGHLVSSKNWPQVKSFESGIFTMEGGWDRGHLVYVPYCSSDAHMGDMEMVTGDLGFIQVSTITIQSAEWDLRSFSGIEGLTVNHTRPTSRTKIKQ